MRACLHLYSIKSEDSLFYQILLEDLDLKENEILEYDDLYLGRLDSEARRQFDKTGLQKGTYRVISTRTEPNQYWGDIRYLFLRPID